MTYAETQDYLFALRSLGSKLGLERMHALYKAAGSPARGISIAHIAGTNGKGSVCAMVEAIGRANGCKTGLFTSPHLLRLGERIQVNRQILSERQIVEYVERFRPLCEQIAADSSQGHPTFFELMTLIALHHFEQEGCDLIVLETGLGGRLDSTNVVQPTVTAITSIGLDHQEILGDTLEQIAAEKVGIIKQGVPLVLGALPQQARAVVLQQAARLGVQVLEASALFDPASLSAATSASGSRPLSAASLQTTDILRPYPQTSLAGGFQCQNGAVALLVYEQMSRGGRLGYDRQTSLAALRAVQWAGRWQRLALADGFELILDSSHNEEGARALEENLSRFVRERGVRPVVIVGALGDVRARALLKVVSKHAQAVFTVAVQQPRACSAEQLRAAMPADFSGTAQTASVEQLFAPNLQIGAWLKTRLQELAPVDAATAPAAGEGDCSQAIAAATDKVARPQQTATNHATCNVPLLVTGSIYLIGEVLTRLHGDTLAEATRLQDKITAST